MAAARLRERAETAGLAARLAADADVKLLTTAMRIIRLSSLPATIGTHVAVGCSAAALAIGFAAGTPASESSAGIAKALPPTVLDHMRLLRAVGDDDAADDDWIAELGLRPVLDEPE